MMVSRKTTKLRAVGVAGVVGLALVASACGGSSGGSNSTASTSTPQPSSSSQTPVSTSGLKIATAKGAAGTYLTDSAGRALYLWDADSNGMSSCMGGCAAGWPPLTTKGKPSAGSGVTASDLGTVKRSDGSMQVTYNDKPLYYFAGDSGPGKAAGQGVNDFGAKWWLVAPSGKAITASASSNGASGDSSSGDSSSSSSSGDAGGGWS
jgi:predicted lipoprotein with Yx(FWY)xxD motif